MKKILSITSAGLVFATGALATIDWNKDFIARFLYSIQMAFGDTDSEIPEPDFLMQHTAHLAKEHQKIMDPELKKWMRDMCIRTQKYISDNNMNIILSPDKNQICVNELNKTNFLEIKCDTTNVCLVLANLQAAFLIDAEQDRRAQQVIDSQTDNQRILHLFAEKHCLSSHNEIKRRYSAPTLSTPEISCAANGNTCVINQLINNQNYVSCCIIKYDAKNLQINYDKVYDTAKIDISYNGTVDVKHPFYHQPINKKLTVSDFDNNCTPYTSVYSDLPQTNVELIENDINKVQVDGIGPSGQQKIAITWQNTKDFFGQ